jgi:uncharacterized repeat protein (TIGR03803 family)
LILSVGPALVVAMFLAGAPAEAAGHFQRLKSFGFPDQIGISPRNALIQGSEGAFYGTTLSGTAGGTVFRVNGDGSGYKVLHDFVEASAFPRGVVEGIDGRLYGTTLVGGTNNAGILFVLSKDGTGYRALHQFQTNGVDGQRPRALALGRDGVLYGTTQYGGSSNLGTVFKINRDGSGHTILRSFGSDTTDGQNPFAGPIHASDGALYGTTYWGGSSNYGTVFKLNTDGSGYAILRSFTGSGGDGRLPQAALVEGGDRLLYGATYSGGTNYSGTLFKLDKDGNGYGLVHTFSSAQDGANPVGITEGPGGILYGAANSGGTYGSGTIFKLNPSGGGFVVLRHCLSGVLDDGGTPAPPTLGSDGALYGTTYMGGETDRGILYKVQTDGSGYTVLRSFNASGYDGSRPMAVPLQGSDGALYGTTYSGGRYDVGTVFKMAPGGTGYTILHDFSMRWPDGQNPGAALVQGADGAFYGTTLGGGTNSQGTAFKLNGDGTGYRILRSFTSSGVGDPQPGALLEASDGWLYGVTAAGGSTNAGTLFKMTTEGAGYVVLFSFPGSAAGSFPTILLEGSDGVFYGAVHYAGGPFDRVYGAIFALNKDGSGYNLLHLFNTANWDGAYPTALIEGSDGALYGTTSGITAAGSNPNTNLNGTVFTLHKDGSGYTMLHSCDYWNGDGTWAAGLVEGTDGMLYGTTIEGGGTNRAGILFRLGKDGSDYSILHSFVAGDDGSGPIGMTQGSDGAFYGVAWQGGSMNCGTVFKLWPPELPILTGISLTAGKAHVSLEGASGCQYQILRSTNLFHWSVLGATSMPPEGVCIHEDADPPPLRAFYRAVWLP